MTNPTARMIDPQWPVLDAWTSHAVTLVVTASPGGIGETWSGRLEGWSTFGSAPNSGTASYWRGWNKYVQLRALLAELTGATVNIELSWHAPLALWRVRLHAPTLTALSVQFGTAWFVQNTIDAAWLGFPVTAGQVSEIAFTAASGGGVEALTVAPLLGVWHPQHVGWAVMTDREVDSRQSSSPYEPRAMDSLVWGVRDTWTLEVDMVPAAQVMRSRAFDLPCTGWAEQARRPVGHTGGVLEQWIPWAMAATPQVGDVPLPANGGGSGTPWDPAFGRPVIAWMGPTRGPGLTGAGTPLLSRSIGDQMRSPTVRHWVLASGQSLGSIASPQLAAGRKYRVSMDFHDVTPVARTNTDDGSAPIAGSFGGDY